MIWSKRWTGLVAAMLLVALVILPSRGSAKDEDEEADAVWMMTIGVASTAYLYQAHLTIGLLADAREKGLYPKEKCSQLQEVNSQLLDATQKQFAEMIKKGDLTSKDAKGIKELARLGELLRKEAQAIEAYWKSGSQADLKKYAEARERMSKSLSEFADK